MAKAWLAGVSSLALIGMAGHQAGAQQPVELPEIVVRAASPIVPRPAALAPAAAAEAVPPTGVLPIADPTFSPVTVLTRAQLDRMPAATLGDALFDRPGVTASTFAPGASSRPVIRGLDNNRVRIQENGIGAMDVSELGEDHGVPIDPLAAQQVEVVRGPATLRYGSQAIGGVVDVFNNRIPDGRGPHGVHGVLQGAATSVDRGGEGAVLLDATGHNVAVHADAYGRATGDYRTPLGTQLNSATRAHGQSLGASYFTDRGFVGFAVSSFSSLYHVPGAEPAEHNTRIDLDQVKVTGKGEYRPDSMMVDAVRYWLGAVDYKHDEKAVHDGIDGVASTFRNREQEGRFEVQLAPLATALGPMTTAVGVQLGHQKLGTDGEATGLLAPAQTTSAAAYIFNEHQLTQTLRLQTAGRIDSVGVDGTATLFPADFLPTGIEPEEERRSRHFMPLSGSVGLLQDLGWGVTASVTGQIVQRAPRAPELFSRGTHEATGTFEIGNPDLGVEQASSIEIGLKRARGAFRFEANAYYTRYKGFIYKHLTGNQCGEEFDDCGVEDELTQVVYSQQDARFHGVEISAQYDVAPLAGGILGIDGQYDFVRATFADGTNVPRMPPHRLGGGVSWRDANWFVRVGLLHAFAQNAIAAHETPTEGYDLLKAELSYTHRFADPRLGLKEATFGLVGTNLLDRVVRNHVSFNKDEVVLPGASVKAFARVVF